MSDGTKIEWTDATWNVVNGCTVVSPGCTNCYAMKQAHRFDVRRGLTQQSKGGMVWTGEVRFNDAVLDAPLRWKRPRRIFVCAHGDLFHEKVPDEWIDRVFAVMALAPHHTFQVLTKRPGRMRAYVAGIGNPSVIGEGLNAAWRKNAVTDAMFDLRAETHRIDWPLPNVWLGTSVEDQRRAEERVPLLLTTPAAVRWLSCEPLLGPVDLRHISTMRFRGAEVLDALVGTLEGMFGDPAGAVSPLDWIVAGGESGPGARPMHPDWLVSLHDQCAATRVPFLFKQWGEFSADQVGPEDARSIGHPPGYVIYHKVGKKAAGRMLHGVTHDGYPDHG